MSPINPLFLSPFLRWSWYPAPAPYRPECIQDPNTGQITVANVVTPPAPLGNGEQEGVESTSTRTNQDQGSASFRYIY